MSSDDFFADTLATLAGAGETEALEVSVGTPRGPVQATARLRSFDSTTLLETWEVDRAGEARATFECYRDRRLSWMRTGDAIAELSPGEYVWMTPGRNDDDPNHPGPRCTCRTCEQWTEALHHVVGASARAAHGESPRDQAVEEAHNAASTGKVRAIVNAMFELIATGKIRNDEPAELQQAERPGRLRLLVPDSGRTWLVQYDEINRIPPASLQLGDVCIVHNATEPGVMFLQVTNVDDPSRAVFQAVVLWSDVS